MVSRILGFLGFLGFLGSLGFLGFLGFYRITIVNPFGGSFQSQTWPMSQRI